MTSTTAEVVRPPETEAPVGPGPWARLRDNRWIYIFLLPTIVLYGLYTLWPIVASYGYSFVDWNGFQAEKTFIGFENYQRVFADPLFWNSFTITVLFMLVTVPMRVSLALAFAVVLTHPKLPFRRLFRTTLFLPVVTTTAIIGVVMQLILDPGSGPITLILQQLGLVDAGVNLLGSSGSALWVVMAVHTWKWLGVTLIYWLAALQTVPPELDEAARMDGANAWQVFRHITLPLLVPFLIIITLLTVEQNLKIFDLMLTMTGGGPFFSTEVIEIYIFRWAFATTIPQLGYASAAAVSFGLLMLVVGVVQVLGLRKARHALRGRP